jgi:filamentous hemagglutinin family protein
MQPNGCSFELERASVLTMLAVPEESSMEATTRSKRRNRRISLRQVPFWRRAVALVLVALQVAYPAAVAAQTVIRPDGRTRTAVGNSGAVWNVSTGTLSGSNAFNSFNAFSVGAGSTVNLHVPSSAANLINIVRDQRTDVYGILNAIKDGRIGGNVWFANPHGFVVGASGVVNVGSLSVTTPTQQFVDNFFLAPGSPDQVAVAQLLSGTAPRSGSGLVSILGKVNATDGISLSAGAINVAGSIYSGARFVGTAPDFTDVVNANGLASATNVVVREGRIQIVADNDVTVSGAIAAPGGAGVRGGDIGIRAGGNVELQSGAIIAARGNGANSAGGTVSIWADNDAVARKGALVDASAGSSGDGGTIEFSAKNTVELAGGEFRADGMGGGKAGSVLIDPWNIVISADILRGASGYGTLPDGGSAAGANLTLLADNEITVNENVTVSTRSVTGTTAAAHASDASTAASGNLTLDAGSISLKSGSKLLAGADNGHAGGDVTLKATRNWTGEAKISVDNAKITGRNVALTANATYNDSILTSWLPVVVPVTVATIDVNSGTINASGTLNLDATSLINVSSSGLSPLGMITAVSAATVDVRGASALTAGGNTLLAASSTVTSKATPGGPNPTTLPGDAGVAMNVVVSTAKTRVGDTSSVTVSSGTLDLTAKNAVTATTKADSTAGGAIAIGGTLALSEVTSVTQAVIDGSATTSSSALKVGAESTSVVTTSAKAASKGAKKQSAAEKAAAPSETEKTLDKYKDQTTTSDGSVDVAAAVAIANVNNITLADIASTGTQTATGAATVSSKASSSSTVTADGSSASGAVGVGAAVGANIGVLVNQARVADNASVSSTGLTVSAVMPTAGKNSFVTTATSGAGASNVGVAGALGTNVLVNTTVATVEGDKDSSGSGATVNANGGDVVVETANTSESKVTAGASVKPASTTEPAAVGVGASVGMNVAVNTTVAEIGNGAGISNAKDLGLKTKGAHKVENAVTGGAAGADVSVTPVAAITVAANTTTARLGTGGLLNLSGAFAGSAEQTGSSTATATGQTQGNNVAVGASIALNNATDTVAAEIDRDIAAVGEVAIGAKSVAKSSASSTASVKGGEKAADTGAPPAKPDGSAGKTVDENVTVQGDAAKDAGKKTAETAAASSPTSAGLAAAAASSDPDTKKAAEAAAANSPASAGLAVAAASNDSKTKVEQTKEAPKTEESTESGGVAVAAAVGVNVGIATTTAAVGKGRTIASTNGALKVTSANETDTTAKADGSQVDPGNTSVGVGAAVALNAGISTNVAAVGDDAVVNTKGLTISAVNAEGQASDAKAEAKSGAGAGDVGVAGSLAANVAINTTVATLEGDALIGGNGSGAAVNAGTGDILIEAGNKTTGTVTSGADVVGTDAAAKVGVGASIGMNIGVNTTVADVGNQAVLTGGENLGLNATANHTLKTDVTGGAAGAKVAVTPLVAATIAVNTTTARLGEGATAVGIGGKYSSTADHTASATTTATGQTKGSSVAVGASIGLTVATDTVVAEIDRNVTADDGAEVNAKSSAKSSTGATASVAGGEKAKDDGSAPAPGGGAGSGRSVDEKVADQQTKATDAGKKTADKAPAAPVAAAGKSASDKLQDSKDNQEAPKTEETTESGGVAVAAAVGVNAGIATTVAKVGKGRTISSTNGALKVKSTSEADASSKADGSQIDSGNTSVGVGAAVALNVGISTNVAVVGENASINTKGLTISAVNVSGEKSDYAAEAKSGAGAGNVGVAGSLAANIVVNTTVAALEGDSASDPDAQGAVVNAGNGDILVEAANATTSTVKSGADVKGTDADAKVGVGASIGVNVGVNTVVAEAGDGSEIDNGKDFGLNATADHAFTTDVTGGAAGAKVSVTPLAAVTVAVNTTTARLGASPVEATLSGKYSSTADHESSATTTATGQTAGSDVAVGVSLGLTSAVDTVTADVERDINATNGVEANAKSTAKSSTSATASVKGGDKAKDDGSAPAAGGGSGSGETVDDKVAGQQNKATAAGKTTAAKAPATTPAAGSTASDKLDTNKQTPPKGETSEGGVSVAAAVGVNVGVATTTARIGEGKRITSSAGALKVTSANQADTSAKAEGSQVDSSKNTDVGVGAAVALNVGVATTTAVVADEAIVSTKGLTISATGIGGEKSDSKAEAKSGAGAGNVGVAGALAINAAVNTTVAQLEGDTDDDASVAQVDADGGAVLIEAQNATTSMAKVSADVKGTDDKAKVGVGASVGVNVAVNTTVAEVGNGAVLADAGSVGLNAAANHAMTTEATGGAAGAKVSVTPVVAAGIAVNTTVARLGEGATPLDVSGAYSSKAEQTSTVTTKATGQAQGDVAVGASLGATIAVDNVHATVERNLDAGNGLELAAKSDTSLTTEVKAGAKGAKAAKKDADGNETPETGTTVDEQKTTQLDFAKSRNSKAAGVNTATPEAKTPDTTNEAPGTDKPTNSPNKEQQGKKVSVAAAIGATVAYNQAKAEIATGRTVGAGSGKLKVSSESDTNYRTLATGEAVSDDVGVAAAVALSATYNKTQANIGSGSTVTAAGDVEIGATSRQNRGADFQKTMSAEAVSGASGGEVAVGGALAAVGNWNETRASIDEGVTIGSAGAPVGDVTVKSDETSKVAAQARAGALSTGDKSKAGVGASFAVLLSYNQNTAAVGYDANRNGSYLPTTLYADSLSVTATKNRVWFLVPTLADAKNFVVNDIKNLNFDALDPSTYLGSNNFYTEAVAGAAAKGNAAVAGAFAVNVFGNTTEAYLGNSVSVTTSGKQPAGEQLGVEVAAHADTQAISFSGAVAGAKKAGVGISNTNIVNLDQTLASIGEDSVVKSNADGAGVKVSAYARQDIANVGVGAAAATEGAGVAGVLGAVVSLAKTEAGIGDEAEVKSKGDIDVEAAGDITAVLVSGGVAGGQSAGVGASIAANVLANATRAGIGDGAKVSAKNNLNVAADADEVAVTAVVAGAGGEKAGVAGAISANVIVGSTEAVVGQGAQINTDAAYDGTAQNVSITAHDDSVVVGIAGGGAGGGKAGVGAALDTTVLVKTVKAHVEDDADGLNVATINADQDVKIDASASEVIASVSMGFAGGGTAGVGGAVSVAVSKNDVQAGIGKSAKVDSEGNVLVNAQDDVTAVLTSGAGAGGGNTGVGASLAVATLLGTTKAYVGDNAQVNARGNRDAATVYTGDTVITLQGDSPAMPGDLLAKKTEPAKGLSVTAYNRENLVTTVVGGAGGGTAGVAATVSANVIANTTEATIGRGAKINESNATAGAEQQVRVKAVDETLLINTAGAGAGGGSAGVGAAANVGVVAKTTKAWIGRGALVNAKQAVELDAASSALTFSTTAGFAGGGSAGVGGAVGAVGVANTTLAFVEDATSAANAAKINVSGGDLALNAADFATSWLVTGAGAGGGAAGVGGSLSVGVNASTTRARIGDYAETDATGTTEVHADSTENVNTITIAGAGGGSAGVAGSIGINVVVSKTEAGIGDHAKVNQSLGGANQNVDVKATDRIITVGAAGAGAGGGAAGVGGSAVATVALNTTSAYIGSGAKVAATQDVKVAASSEKYVNSAAVAGAGGGAAGVAGAVSVISVGSLLDGEAKSGLQTQDEGGNTVTTQSQADGQTTKSAVGGMLGTSAQSTETTGVLDSNAGKLAVSQHMADTATVPLKNTQAFIGYNATVKAGRDVTVAAKDTTLAINANGAGAGGGAAGVAGSLGVTLLHDSAEVFIANGAKVDADRNLSVKAETGETVVNLGVTGYGGGAAGVGGSAAVNVVTSTTSAYIGDADINQDATTSTERSVEIKADSNSNLIAVAGSGGGAGAAAVGGVLNVNTLAKSTKAFIGEGASVEADKNVIVSSQSAQNIVSAGISIQGAGAAAVGGAATVNVVANTTEAFIGSARDDNTKTAAVVDSDGNVVVAAADDTLVVAVAGSGTGAGAAAVGGAVGANVISSQTRAYVGDNTAINARGNAAGASVDAGTVGAAGAMPSLPSGVSGDIDADRNGTNDGDVSNGASFTLAGGGASTGVNPSAVKDSQGADVGSATGGLGTRNKETATGLSVTATGNQKIVSAAIGVAGAGAAGVTGTATADVIVSQTAASIGDGAQINQSGAVGAGNDVRVRAADNSLVVMASGTIAGAGAAAVSGSANTAVIAKQTQATIGDADVKARDVDLQAKAVEDIYIVTVNASVAGAAGVGAAAGVGVIANQTLAGIQAGATIDASRDIRVAAEQASALDIYTVSGAGGIAGVSGAFSVGVIDNTTRAYVEGGTSAATAVTLDAGGETAVSATSTEEITTGTVSAAGGGVGVAGAVGVKVVTSETTAEIGDYTKVNQTRRGGALQDVQVAAADTVRLAGGGGSGAFGAYGAGATAEINVVRNTTTASIGNHAIVRADNDIGVDATSTKDVQSAAVAAAGGASAGIAGAVSLAFVGASIQSDSDAKSGIGNGATATAADSTMKKNSVGSELGDSEHVQGTKSELGTRSAALGVSGELNDASTTPRDKTRAFVGSHAQLVAGGKVDVTATDRTRLDQRAVGAAGGAVGIGAAVGVGITHSTTEAFVDQSSTIDADGDVTVAANAGNVDANGSRVESWAGAGGVVGLSASVAVLKDTSTTRSYLGSNVDVIDAARLSVAATTDRKATTATYGASAGIAAIGASVAVASFKGATTATLGTGVQVDADAVEVSATDDSVASAHSRAGSAGIVAGSGSVATAEVTSTVTAEVGNSADIDATGDVDVIATGRASTKADAIGVNVGAGAVGASVATATSGAKVHAKVGENVDITGASFDLIAKRAVKGGAPTAQAHALGAAGGLLLGANGSVATANSAGETVATVGTGSTITTSGTTAVKAENTSLQSASAFGVTSGLLALGANFSYATSDALTQASLGNDVAVSGGGLQVSATGNDSNYSFAKAGAGGLLTVPYSAAYTKNISRTYAITGSGDAARKVDVGSFYLGATQTCNFDRWIESTVASLVGVSGAQAKNTVNIDTQALLGTSAWVEADSVTMQAGNTINKGGPGAKIPGTAYDTPGWNVVSSSGGLADVPAAESATTIVADALLQVGAGAHFEQNGTSGSFRLDAWNELAVTDKVKMASGGAVSAASAKSSIMEDVAASGSSPAVVNRADASVVVAPAADLVSDGDMALGARSQANVYSQAAVDVYGLVGVAPEGTSIARFKGTNTVEIGAGATLSSDGDVRLSAGSNTSDMQNALTAVARTDVFNNTAIPVNRDPVADAVVDAHSQINLKAGSRIDAAGDVMLYADEGQTTASGVGIGKDIYREALAAIASAISNAFGGGDVSFETRTGNSVKRVSSDVAINGEVHVGTNRQQQLVVGLDGTVTYRKGDIDIIATDFRDVAADIQARIQELDVLIAKYDVNTPDASVAVAAYRSERTFLQRKLKDLGFPDGQVAASPNPDFTPLKAAQQSVTGMTTLRTTYDTTKTDLTTQNGTLTTQNTDLTSNNTTLTNNNTTLTNDNNTLTSVAIPALIATRAALDPDSSTYTTDYNNLTNQITTAQNTVNSNTETINNNNTTINNNNTTIASNNGTISANNVQITDLTTKISSLDTQIGIINTGIANGEYPDTALSGPASKFLTVSDATARLGNIYLRGDRVQGAGTLDAPGDAAITIDNYGPNFLLFRNLAIPADVGGKIYMNGVEVNDNAGINHLNGASGGGGFAITTAQSSGAAPPAITIRSHYDPLSDTPPANTPNVAPDLVFQGDISNPRGSVTIRSEAGSVRLEQKRDANGVLLDPVETASIRANDVEIVTRNGDFVQSYTNTFFHTAGAPLTVTPGDPNLPESNPARFSSIARTPEASGKGIVANGSVLIAARYLNINGIIQSGIAEWGVHVPAGATVSIPGNATASFAQAMSHYNALSDADKAKPNAALFDVGSATVFGLSAAEQGKWEQIRVRYNAKEDRLELGGVQVQGGYIELFGQIFNTNMHESTGLSDLAGGQLRVLDGYGKINVSNLTSKALWINTLDAGRGTKGEINISNIVGIADGSVAGVPAGTALIATQTFTRNSGDARSGSFYTPSTGLRYAAQVGKETGWTDNYRYSSGAIIGIEAFPTQLDQYWINRVYSNNVAIPNNGEFLGMLGTAHTGEYQRVNQTQTTSSAPKQTASWFVCNWWTLCAYGTYYKEFEITSLAKTITTDSLKADNRIAIKFIGFDSGAVNVSSTGDVVINGAISNRSGDTAIATSGSLLQGKDIAVVGGSNIQLAAGMGIGSTAATLQVNTGDSGRLDAVSTSGDVRIRETLGDLRIGTVGGANVSTVALEADRSIVNADVNSYVQGKRVELASDNGSIGIAGDALTVRTGYSATTADWSGLGLKATARDDINISNEADAGNAAYSGNLLLISAESKAGDVRIETAGSVIDNNPFATTDTRTEAELAALWDDLRLRGPASVAKGNEAVDAYRAGKNVNYALYWKMRGSQADGGVAYSQEYRLTNAERSALAASGMTTAQIDQFEVNRRTQYQQLHAEVGGLTATYVAGYDYVVSAAESAQISKGATWSDTQLALSVGAGLLKNITDTVTTIKQPNAKGRSVTLIANGNIGSYDAPEEIDLTAGLAALTTAQKAALAAAERGDATFDDPGNPTKIIVVQPRPVNVEVGAGMLNASTATGYALIGSEQDLRIDRVSAASDVRIKTAGSLINAASVSGATNVSGDKVILEAANGGIGSLPDADGNIDTPLRVDADDELIARAAQDIWIESPADLDLDTVYSRNDVRLAAQGSIGDAHASESAITPEINVRARNTDLTAVTGSIGAPDNALDMGVNRDGAISAAAATFGQGVYLNGPAGEYFNIGSVISGDALSLSCATDMKIDGLVRGSGAFTLSAGGAMLLTPKADLHATTLGVFLRAGSLEMQDAQFMIDNGETLDPKYVAGDAARMRVDAGTIDIETVGDALITGIETGNPTESAIRVVSTDGRILDNGDTRLDIIADTPPEAKLTIDAKLGIGANPLDVRLLNLQANSDAGVVDLAVQNSVNIVAVTAADRVLLTAGGDITGNTVTSTGAVTGSDPANPATGVTIASATGRVELAGVSSAQDVSISAPTAITVDQMNVGTALSLASDRISANVNGGAGSVGGSVTGFGGGVASDVNLTLSGPGGFAFSNFWAETANVGIPLGSFWVDNALILDQAIFTNPLTSLLVDQHNRSIQPSDVQLYSAGAPFYLGLSGNHVATDAFVIHRSPLHEVITPDGSNTSAVEQSEDALATIARLPGFGRQAGEEEDEPLIAYTGHPVSLEDECDPELNPDCRK